MMSIEKVKKFFRVKVVRASKWAARAWVQHYSSRTQKLAFSHYLYYKTSESNQGRLNTMSIVDLLSACQIWLELEAIQ